MVATRSLLTLGLLATLVVAWLLSVILGFGVAGGQESANDIASVILFFAAAVGVFVTAVLGFLGPRRAAVGSVVCIVLALVGALLGGGIVPRWVLLELWLIPSVPLAGAVGAGIATATGGSRRSAVQALPVWSRPPLWDAVGALGLTAVVVVLTTYIVDWSGASVELPGLLFAILAAGITGSLLALDWPIAGGAVLLGAIVAGVALLSLFRNDSGWLAHLLLSLCLVPVLVGCALAVVQARAAVRRPSAAAHPG